MPRHSRHWRVSVPDGKAPYNVQASPDGKLVWVTNNGEPAQAATSVHKEMVNGEQGAMATAGAV